MPTTAAYVDPAVSGILVGMLHAGCYGSPASQQLSAYWVAAVNRALVCRDAVPTGQTANLFTMIIYIMVLLVPRPPYRFASLCLWLKQNASRAKLLKTVMRGDRHRQTFALRLKHHGSSSKAALAAPQKNKIMKKRPRAASRNSTRLAAGRG